MLYVTTRGSRDAFTAHRTLCTDHAPDNGCYIPMRFPHFSVEEISALSGKPFEETVADVLNIFFSAGLTQWDVAFCIGRNSARIYELNPRICCAELWHNTGNGFEYLLNSLYVRIFGQKTASAPSEWFRIAVKFAVLFGIYGMLCREAILQTGDKIDISVPTDDFSYPIAALYAQDAGLPISNIVCNCVKTHEVWNLIYRGVVDLNDLPDCLQSGIERFFFHWNATESIDAFAANKRSVRVSQDMPEIFQKTLSCFVSGQDRVSQTLNSVYRSSGQFLTPDAALSLAGLGDYRAKTGEIKSTLIIEEDSPILFAEQVERATGVTLNKLKECLRE